MAWGKRRGAPPRDSSRGFLPAFPGCTKAAVKAAPEGGHVSHAPERHMSDGYNIFPDRQGNAGAESCLLGGARSLPPAPRRGARSARSMLGLARRVECPCGRLSEEKYTAPALGVQGERRVERRIQRLARTGRRPPQVNTNTTRERTSAGRRPSRRAWQMRTQQVVSLDLRPAAGTRPSEFRVEGMRQGQCPPARTVVCSARWGQSDDAASRSIRQLMPPVAAAAAA